MSPWAEALWARLFHPERGGGAEVQKWVAFGRRLVLVTSGLVLAVGTTLTLFFVLQAKGLLERSLRERGYVLAKGIAREAFVPIMLEDDASLEELLAEPARQPDVIALAILDEGGTTRARAGRSSGGERALELAVPIVRPRAARGAGGSLGGVRVRLSMADADRRLAALVAAGLLVNGALIAAVSTLGLFLIRRMTLRMQDLVDEARLAAELKRSNRELEEFAYIASHDLQSPLRKVSGFAQILEEKAGGSLDAEARECVTFIVDGVRRMQRLIEDLLSYSRVGSGRLKPERVDVGEVVKEVLSDLAPVIAQSGAQVSVGPLPSLVGDRGQLSRLFQNLLSNALKFRGEAPPKVEVAASREGRRWRFAVKDNGIGIDPRHAPQLFRMFRRLHPVNAYPGSGIGLAVARKVVERHGGGIRLESAPGSGTTFHFTLDAVTEAAPAPPTPPKEVSHAD